MEERKDPYKILIAEVMLQRTKAEQVEPVYLKFIDRFSGINYLAGAHIGDVFPAVKTLGLSRRSRILIQMADEIISNFGGKVPPSRGRAPDHTGHW